MYSICLMMSLAAPAQAPSGILRGGCSGVFQSTRERIVVRSARPMVQPVRGLIALAVDFLRSRLAANSVRGVSRSVTVTRTTGPSVAIPAPEPEVMEGRGRLVTRLAVHRQLAIALRTGKLTPAQARAANAALNDRLVYEAAVRKVTNDLNRQLESTGSVRAIGDGTLLRILLDNLPMLIEAILRIIDALTLYEPSPSAWALAA